MNLRKLKKKIWPKRVMKLNKRYQKYIVPFNGELRILELVLIAHGTVASGKQPRKLLQALLKKQVNHRYSAYIIYCSSCTKKQNERDEGKISSISYLEWFIKHEEHCLLYHVEKHTIHEKFCCHDALKALCQKKRTLL